jgi:hypothetical protein
VIIKRKRYQQGSICKVRRAKGFAWEFRYCILTNGKRILKIQIFDCKMYRTEAEARRVVNAQLPQLNDGIVHDEPVAVMFGALLDRYIAEEIPPRKSTRDCYMSLISNHLRPRWENMLWRTLSLR